MTKSNGNKMSFYNRILPFYGVIENFFQTGGEIIRHKVIAGEERKTKRESAEIEIYLKTEYEKQASSLRNSEKLLEHKNKIETMEKESELADLPKRLAHERQLEFEKHRFGLFEKWKRLEMDIKMEIGKYDEEKMKALWEWRDQVMNKLEDEHYNLLIQKLPEILRTAVQFEGKGNIYEEFQMRAYQFVDKTVESIIADKEVFRKALDDINSRHGDLTEVMVEMSRKFQIGLLDQKAIGN